MKELVEYMLDGGSVLVESMLQIQGQLSPEVD